MKSLRLKGSLNKLPFFLALVLFSFSSCEEDSGRKVELLKTETVRNKLEEGDILLKCGYGQISKLITMALNEQIKISHAAIVVKNNNQLSILHSVSGQIASDDGVQSITLDSFLMDVRPNSFFILRPQLQNQVIDHVIEIAESKLQSRIPFDDQFDHKDTTSLYCSEFIQFVYKRGADIECFKTKQIAQGDIYAFNDILSNPSFEIVFKW